MSNFEITVTALVVVLVVSSLVSLAILVSQEIRAWKDRRNNRKLLELQGEASTGTPFEEAVQVRGNHETFEHPWPGHISPYIPLSGFKLPLDDLPQIPVNEYPPIIDLGHKIYEHPVKSDQLDKTLPRPPIETTDFENHISDEPGINHGILSREEILKRPRRPRY